VTREPPARPRATWNLRPSRAGRMSKRLPPFGAHAGYRASQEPAVRLPVPGWFA